VPTELLEKWQQLYKQPDSVRHFEIDCLVWLKGAVKIEVHGFTDASEMTYTTCVYLMSVNHREEGKSFIVFTFWGCTSKKSNFPKVGTVRSIVGTVRSSVGTVSSIVGTVSSSVGTVRSSVGTVSSSVGTVSSSVGTVSSSVGTVKIGRAHV
jgi:rRNA processing protein Gar1